MTSMISYSSIKFFMQAYRFYRSQPWDRTCPYHVAKVALPFPRGHLPGESQTYARKLDGHGPTCRSCTSISHDKSHHALIWKAWYLYSWFERLPLLHSRFLWWLGLSIMLVFRRCWCLRHCLRGRHLNRILNGVVPVSFSNKIRSFCPSLCFCACKALWAFP